MIYYFIITSLFSIANIILILSYAVGKGDYGKSRYLFFPLLFVIHVIVAYHADDFMGNFFIFSLLSVMGIIQIMVFLVMAGENCGNKISKFWRFFCKRVDFSTNESEYIIINPFTKTVIGLKCVYSNNRSRFDTEDFCGKYKTFDELVSDLRPLILMDSMELIKEYVSKNRLSICISTKNVSVYERFINDWYSFEDIKSFIDQSSEDQFSNSKIEYL